MVFKANAFYEEKKYSLLIKIIVCQGAMIFNNFFCRNTVTVYTRKHLSKSRSIQQIMVLDAFQPALQTREMNFVHRLVVA